MLAHREADAIKFLDDGGKFAIFDATNSTHRSRRVSTGCLEVDWKEVPTSPNRIDGLKKSIPRRGL